MIFQGKRNKASFEALFNNKTILENITLAPLHLKKFKTKEEANKIAFELLETIGLKDKANAYPSTLSGGQKQRVAIVRALAMEPQIVFYDEPTAGLDPVMTMTISRLIRKTQQRLGVASLLVTHDMESVFMAADRIAMLYNGKIVQVGTVDEIKNSSNPVVRAFISGQELKKEDLNG